MTTAQDLPLPRQASPAARPPARTRARRLPRRHGPAVRRCGCCRSSSCWSPRPERSTTSPRHGARRAAAVLHLDGFRRRWVDGGQSAARCINSVHRHRLHGGCCRWCSPPRRPSRSAATASRCGARLLLIMLAGNLLPPQILLIPVSQASASRSGIYDTLFALVGGAGRLRAGLLHLRAARLHAGACPDEIFEAALDRRRRDRAHVYWRIVLPLCRPALAALGRAGHHVDLQRPALGDDRAAHRERSSRSPRPCSTCRAAT